MPKEFTGYVGKKAIELYKELGESSTGLPVYTLKGTDKDWMEGEWPPVKVRVISEKENANRPGTKSKSKSKKKKAVPKRQPKAKAKTSRAKKKKTSKRK
jgi:hypothetical protein